MSTTPTSRRHSSRRTPFLNTQFLIACVIFIAITLALAGFTFIRHGFDWLVLLFPLVALGFTLFAWYTAKRPLTTLNRLHQVLQACCKGEVHHRITHTAGLGEIGLIAWELNDFLDIMETYFKEVNTCFRRVGEGTYHRKPYSNALPGQLRWKRTYSTSPAT
jgi:HAMP domain-containing protein